MSDVTLPLRHVYGEEPQGAALRPGYAGYGEQEALRELRCVLDAWPTGTPSERALEAVAARALETPPPDALEAESAVEAAVLDQSARALDRLPRPAPSASVLEAVLARASSPSAALGAEGPVEAAVLDQSLGALAQLPRLSPPSTVLEAVVARAAETSAQVDAPALEVESPVEAAVLDQSLRALDRLPRPGAPAHVLEAVVAAAATGDALAAVRSVCADGPAVGGVEAAVLEQSRAALERAFAGRPQPRPDAASVEAVLARAAEASGLEGEAVPATGPVEAAVLAQSHRALDRLPRPGAPAAALDAVRIAAATATNQAAPAAEPEPVPVPTPSRTGWWAGAGALVLAALAAIAVLPDREPAADAPAVAAIVETAPEPAPVERDVAGGVARDAAPDASSPPVAGPLAASAAVSGFVPVREVTRSEPVPDRRTAEPPRATVAPSAVAAASQAAPTWDAPDDVRALSMRLGELDPDDVIDWEEPAEAFGVPTSPTRTSAPGVRAVRDGAPPAVAPDSTRN